MVYLPTVLFALGEGALVPLVPVIATKLGADVGLAALISSALVIGQLCGNLPAGYAVARLGERYTMVIAASVAVIAAVGMAVAPTLPLITLTVFIIGFAAAAFGLARHSFMTTRVPLIFRARALALLGGTFRLGMFIGPFVAAALLAIFQTENAAVWFFVVIGVLLVFVVLFGPDPETIATAARPSSAWRDDSGEPVTGSIPVHERLGVFRTMIANRSVLMRLGLSAAALSSARSARQVILPLWGVSLGLDAPTIALVVGVSGALDFALFYVSGQIMDRFGRLWAALPAMLLMSAAFLALAITHDGDAAVLWYGMIAVVLGVGNGLSSGILMTLGADLAPRRDPAAFLGSWRTLTDAGGAFSPLVVSLVTTLVSLAAASAVVGFIGLIGAVGFLRFIPRYVPRPGEEFTPGP